MRWVFCLLFFCSVLYAKRVEIYEDWAPDASGDAMFQESAIASGRYQALRKAFEEKGYSVRCWDRRAHFPWMMSFKQIHGWMDFMHWLGFSLPRKNPFDDETKYVFFTGIGLELRDWNLNGLRGPKLNVFIWEPPSVQPEAYDLERQKCFHRIYTFDDDLVDNRRYFKFYLPFLRPHIQSIVPYEDRKFLTLIASRLKSKYIKELYSEREKVCRFFETQEDGFFDLYGRGWKRLKFKNWKGQIPGSFDEKIEVLKNYKFAFAYENSHNKGYITEKLWHCFAAGVVPIYWGADNVTDYVPADCFVDRRKFGSNEELLDFLKAMTKSEWEGYVQRGEQFLQTEMALRFTDQNYIRTMAEALGN